MFGAYALQQKEDMEEKEIEERKKSIACFSDPTR